MTPYEVKIIANELIKLIDACFYDLDMTALEVVDTIKVIANIPDVLKELQIYYENEMSTKIFTIHKVFGIKIKEK